MSKHFKTFFALLALAFLLRVGVAVITNYNPIFPSYYYSDARIYENEAWKVASAWRKLQTATFSLNYQYFNFARTLAPAYFIFGHHPIVLKFYSIAIGMLALFLLFLITQRLFNYKVAVIALILLAFYPSHIYWSSQILKESFVMLGLALILYGSIMFYESIGIIHIFLLSVGILLIGLLRIYYLLPILLFVVLIIFALNRADKKNKWKWSFLLIPLFSFMTIGFLYAKSNPLDPIQILSPTGSSIKHNQDILVAWKTDATAAKFVIFWKRAGQHLQRIKETSGRENSTFIPAFNTDFGNTPIMVAIIGYNSKGQDIAKGTTHYFFVTKNYTGPLTSKPQTFSHIVTKKRNNTIINNYINALTSKLKTFPHVVTKKRDNYIIEIVAERPPNTLLFPKENFLNYWDIVKFIPKACFYILFMPLPGIYPINNLGRILASGENIFLLIIFIVSIIGIVTLKKDIRHCFLILALMLFIGIHSIIDVDLGTATRHKIQYFPIIFMFSAWILSQWFLKNKWTELPKK